MIIVEGDDVVANPLQIRTLGYHCHHRHCHLCRHRRHGGRRCRRVRVSCVFFAQRLSRFLGK